MKKLMLLFVFMLSMTTFAVDGYLRLGGITNSSEYNGKDTSMDSYAPTLGLEVKQSLLLFDVGAGIAYNGSTGGADLKTVPAYVMARWNIIPIGVEPYIVGKVGRVLYTDDSVSNGSPDGTNYYAIGVGVEVTLVQAELLYSITSVDDDIRGNDDLKQISLVVGLQLF